MPLNSIGTLLTTLALASSARVVPMFSPALASGASVGSANHREANDEFSTPHARTWFGSDGIGHRFALFDFDKSVGINIHLKLFRLWRFGRRVVPGDNWRFIPGTNQKTVISSPPARTQPLHQASFFFPPHRHS